MRSPTALSPKKMAKPLQGRGFQKLGYGDGSPASRAAHVKITIEIKEQSQKQGEDTGLTHPPP
jgi:hypothetical protein